jgi:hypothetical protein
MDERLQVEHRVQRLGRKEEREGLLDESQKRAKEGGMWRSFKGKGRTVALGRQICGGRFDFWNLAHYTVILKRCSPYFVQSEWGYISHTVGRGGTAEQSKAKMQNELTSYLVPGAERKYWADERDLNLGDLLCHPSLAGSPHPGRLAASACALGARDGAW